MSNSEQKNENLVYRNHSSDPNLSISSKILEGCIRLKEALSEYSTAQCMLDGEYFLSSPISEIEALLSRIRSARRKCVMLAERLFQMFPKTPLETNAVHNILNAYRAQVDVDQMPCTSSYNEIYQENRDLNIEAVQSKAQAEQRVTFNILLWGKWPKRSSLPKRR